MLLSLSGLHPFGMSVGILKAASLWSATIAFFVVGYAQVHAGVVAKPSQLQQTSANGTPRASLLRSC